MAARSRQWLCTLASIALSAIAASPVSVFAANAVISWTPPTSNTDGSPLTDLSGYRLYSGCVASGQYERAALTLGTITSYDLGGLPSVGTCYFALGSLNAAGTESARSNEAAKFMGALAAPANPPAGPVITWARQSTVSLPVTDTFAGASANLSDPPYHNAHSVSLKTDGSGNCIAGSSGTDDLATQNAETFTTGQSVEIVVSGLNSAGNRYVYLLLNITGDDVGGYMPGYWFWTDGVSDTVLNRGSGGTESAVDSDATFTVSDGDTLKLTNDGAGTISLTKNGSATSISYNDGSPLTLGRPGIGIFDSSAGTVKIATVTFDNVGGAAATAQQKLMLLGVGQ